MQNISSLIESQQSKKSRYRDKNTDHKSPSNLFLNSRYASPHKLDRCRAKRSKCYGDSETLPKRDSSNRSSNTTNNSARFNDLEKAKRKGSLSPHKYQILDSTKRTQNQESLETGVVLEYSEDEDEDEDDDDDPKRNYESNIGAERYRVELASLEINDDCDSVVELPTSKHRRSHYELKTDTYPETNGNRYRGDKTPKRHRSGQCEDVKAKVKRVNDKLKRYDLDCDSSSLHPVRLRNNNDIIESKQSDLKSTIDNIKIVDDNYKTKLKHNKYVSKLS